MAVKLRPDGTLEFDSVSEAVEFQRLRMQSPSARAPRVDAPLKIGPPEDTGVVPGPRLAREEQGPCFTLSLLAEAGRRGVPTDELAIALGLSNPRGVSGVAQNCRRHIQRKCNGTPVDKLFWSSGPPGKKRWHVDGPKLKELGILH